MCSSAGDTATNQGNRDMTKTQLESLIIQSANENAANACSALWEVNIDEVTDFINVDGSKEQKLFKMIRSDIIKNFDVDMFAKRLKTNKVA